MEKEILTALIDMVKSGGQLAIWGIVAYWFMVILKVAVKGGFIWGCLITICNLITHCWDNYQIRRKELITLISKEASDSLVASIKAYQTEVNLILKDITKRLENLKQKSDTSTTKSF